MKIRITAKHQKGSKYVDNYDCPLARALKARGYKRVEVRGYTGTFYRNGKKVNVQFDFNPLRLNGKPFTLDLQILK